ncbi:uncharacterized protein MONBRDRAFT_36233 [Monosiga brevicollis MX1]|uniref:Uncharacterized protein n=1 Tax=Monosiga brevicollis TaxID=81824 RepID=A9UTX7_MONBE|nr:uncharacterized protein MONBRDRAFT_36233 [Monosiga brevicollis MX1]EDQ91570.1 predicted protein [Monosiga brevicollis MX1]|eukprot:XP_001743992.1 hypothetical protein [Monosiga brevicollis MX1]
MGAGRSCWHTWVQGIRMARVPHGPWRDLYPWRHYSSQLARSGVAAARLDHARWIATAASPSASAKTLYQHQTDCIEQSLTAFGQHDRVAVSMPTGSGKTVVFSHLLARLPAPTPSQHKVLVLAHRTELLAQAKRQIEAHNPNLRVDIEGGHAHADVDAADVIVASVPTLGRPSSVRLSRFDPAEFKLIIIDEAHHAAASTYKRILHHFFDENRSNPYDVKLWGCSATLQRHDGLGLDDVFDTIAYSVSLETLLDEGFLAPVRGMKVDVDLKLDQVRIRKGEYDPAELSRLVNTNAQNELVVEQWRRYCQNERRSTLVFGVDIRHVLDLQEQFKSGGVQAESITSLTPNAERKRILQAFSDGEFPVLLNCTVLTEGTDLPCVDALIMARPTRSHTLFVQMLGRGLRLHPDKKDCLVIDVANTFASNSLSSRMATLMGLKFTAEDDGAAHAHAIAPLSV